MTRHTVKELTSMARQTLAAHERGDPRAQFLLMWLASKYNCSSAEVLARIRTLAGGDE